MVQIDEWRLTERYMDGGCLCMPNSALRASKFSLYSCSTFWMLMIYSNTTHHHITLLLNTLQLNCIQLHIASHRFSTPPSGLMQHLVTTFNQLFNILLSTGPFSTDYSWSAQLIDGKVFHKYEILDWIQPSFKVIKNKIKISSTHIFCQKFAADSRKTASSHPNLVNPRRWRPLSFDGRNNKTRECNGGQQCRGAASKPHST